jgi:hypothetical protein
MEYVTAQPGCCTADVDRACRCDPLARHQRIYVGVRPAVIRVESKVHGKVV